MASANYYELRYGTPTLHCKQSIYVQPVWVSARRPLATTASLPGAQVSNTRLRRIWTRHWQLLLTPVTVWLSESQQAKEQAQRWAGFRTFEVRMNVGNLYKE